MEPGQPDEILPYLSLANKIGMLPEKDFQFALKQLKYYRHPVSQVIVNSRNWRRFTLKEAKEEIRSWAIRPSLESTFEAVDNEAVKSQCLKLLRELQEIGQRVAVSATAFLKAERECAMNQRYFREGTNVPYAHEVDMETDVISFCP